MIWGSLKRHWFLLALGLCFSLGFAAADELGFLLDWNGLRNGIVFAVMWATGVTLRADAVRRSVASPLPSLLAIGINVAWVPALSLLCDWLLPAWLLPNRLAGGLFVATLVPCTLASAAVWTRKAGGDDSIALLTTVTTNLGCVLVVPLGVWIGLGREAEVSAEAQMIKLAGLVVAPLVLAQAMRRVGWGKWADRHRITLGTASQVGILMMVVFGAIASARVVQQGREAEASAAAVPLGALAVTAVVLCGIAIHLVALLAGIASSRAVGADRPRQIAVGFAGSQKTLMVGLQIAIDCGVSVVPMIAYHLGQLVLDTLIAQRWKAQTPPDLGPPPSASERTESGRSSPRGRASEVLADPPSSRSSP